MKQIYIFEKYVHIWLLPVGHFYYKNKRKGNCANNTAALQPTTYCECIFSNTCIILN